MSSTRARSLGRAGARRGGLFGRAPVPPPRRFSGRLDLHCHSDASDGKFPPHEVLARAAAGRIDVLALTDHDLAPVLAAGVHEVDGRPVRVLHATEVSGTHEGKELHLLVYFPGDMPAAYVDFLRERAASRAVRYEAAVRALGLTPGVEVPAPDADERAGLRALTRHHLVRRLRDAGLVADSREGFAKVAPALPRIALSFVDAIRAARAAGGLTSWAHPDRDDAQSWTRTFVDAGLQGLEGARPAQDRTTRNLLKNLAEKHGLLVTGGSDWHGWHDTTLGSFTLEGERAERFCDALGVTPPERAPSPADAEPLA